MGFLDELKRLARPYEDEEEEEEFDDFEPVSRSERMDRTGGDRLERKAPKAQDSTGPIFPVENERRSNKVVNIHTTTQLYDPADYDVVLVCGPTVMMRNAARLCAEKGTPCFVSLEKKMACGIGACLGCTCETRSGEGKSVCKNGPVFDAAEVF